MTIARQKVLAHLKKIRAASAREIARALNMSAPNVRHHLSVLCSDGRVDALGTAVNNREGRGRPEKMYSLSQAALGDNLSALSEALLAEAGSKVRVEAVAGRLIGDSNFAGQPIAKRLNLIVEKLNQMNYHARWEAGAGGPRILFGHCPYAAIITRHPELCAMDAALLKELFGDELEQIAKIENFQGTCVFITR